ncbi:MAG: hypothetical protein U0487_02015 [Patescibacteria group bacterium]
MSIKTVPTANELIALAGLNESPDKIVERARKIYNKTYQKVINPSYPRKIWNRYVEWRPKYLSRNESRFLTVFMSLSVLVILLLVAVRFGHVGNGDFTAFMAVLALCSLIVFLSPFNPFLLSEKKSYDEHRGRKPIVSVALFDPNASIRSVYIAGLKRVENELIGPESDWSKTLVDLRARNDKATQQQDRLDARIKEAQRAGDDDRYQALVSTKTRLRVSERGLVEAIESTHQLINATRAEIAKLYKLVDSMGDTYADAELIAEIDQSIEGNDRAVDHAKQLRDQAYEKISIQLTAVAATVIGHKLLPNPSVAAIDMPRYLEEVEKATEAIVKISES